MSPRGCNLEVQSKALARMTFFPHIKWRKIRNNPERNKDRILSDEGDLKARKYAHSPVGEFNGQRFLVSKERLK